MRIFLLFALLAAPAFAEDTPQADAMSPRPVMSEIVSPQTRDPIRIVGVVAARSEADLGFPMVGTIAERPVDSGDLVRKGDVLARLNPEDFDSDVRSAEAGVTVASAQLRSARDAENRARQLSERGSDSTTRLEDAERALTAAEARLEQARATLTRAEDMRSFATLESPADGVITKTYEEPGASLASGQPVVRLAGTVGREITIDVSERDAAGLKLGTVLDATLAANPTVTVQATLVRIDPVAARSTRTRRVHLRLNDPPVGFRLGALVHVSPGASTQIGVNLELTAILGLPQSPAVWIVDRKTNTVHLTPVTLGQRFGTRVRITEGLSAGDEVVTKGINSLKDGQIVGSRVSE